MWKGMKLCWEDVRSCASERSWVGLWEMTAPSVGGGAQVSDWRLVTENHLSTISDLQFILSHLSLCG